MGRPMAQGQVDALEVVLGALTVLANPETSQHEKLAANDILGQVGSHGMAWVAQVGGLLAPWLCLHVRGSITGFQWMRYASELVVHVGCLMNLMIQRLGHAYLLYKIYLLVVVKVKASEIGTIMRVAAGLCSRCPSSNEAFVVFGYTLLSDVVQRRWRHCSPEQQKEIEAFASERMQKGKVINYREEIVVGETMPVTVKDMWFF